MDITRRCSAWWLGFGAAGCLIANLAFGQDVRAAGSQVTFSKDVAPILQRSCQVCHRPGSIAPMSLLTYDDARPWVRAIRQKVANRTMPPWTIDRTVGIQKFLHDRSLTDQEVATIVNWADSGALRGNPADMPPPVEFLDASKWTLGSMLGGPDVVIPIPEPFVVDPNAPNVWIDMIADYNFTEDRWVRAVETKPSLEGFPVVHHVLTSLYQESAPEEAIIFSEYALGKTGDIFAEESGFLIKAGTKVRFNLHYASIGERRIDRTSLGLWLYPKGYVPKYKHVRQAVGEVADLDLPPGESNIRHDGYQVLNENVRLTVFQPHLHNRGKRQCLEVIYPDSRVETINCVNWDFGWHIAYNYPEDVQPLLPKGTVLHVATWHDNSSANKWNPDPRNWAGYGQRSSDDMALAHISWYALSDEEFSQQVKSRQDKLRNRPSSANQP